MRTGRSLTESDDTRCCVNKIWPPEEEQDIARNMYEVQSKSNAYIFIVTVQELLLQPR